MCEELQKVRLDKCYCNEDQGAGYTYRDEHGRCEYCKEEEKRRCLKNSRE